MASFDTAPQSYDVKYSYLYTKPNGKWKSNQKEEE